MTKSDKYLASFREIEIRLKKNGELISDLGNTAAVLKKRLNYFWIGFYFLKDNRLVLGPFQGTPACVYLSLDSGVCAEAVKRGETVIVENVHEFPGHIACDPNSKSEIVVPIFNDKGEIKAVLDVDDDSFNSFDSVDKEWLEKIAGLFSQRV